VRLQLDPYAASLATIAAGEDDIREIERLSEARASKDPLEQVRLNRAFHRAIYASCGNSTLIDILDRLWERTDRYRIMLLARDTVLLAATREHIEIARAMQSRQPRLVAKLVRDHVAKAQALIRDALTP
jgi:DNA-binding GntR family transcriptional regulator